MVTTDITLAIDTASKAMQDSGPAAVCDMIYEAQKAVSMQKRVVDDAEDALRTCPESERLYAAKEEMKLREAMLETLKGYMVGAMNDTGLRQVETKEGDRFSVITSPGALEIVDEAKLREMRGDLFVEKTTVVPDKKAIKAAIEAGNIPTDWAVIKKSQSLSVTKAE